MEIDKTGHTRIPNKSGWTAVFLRISFRRKRLTFDLDINF